MVRDLEIEIDDAWLDRCLTDFWVGWMEEEDLNLSLLLESTFAFWFSHPSHLTLTSGWLLRVPTQNVG